MFGGHPFSGDGHSLKATFPWKRSAAIGYLKSLDAENQQKVKRLTQGHMAFTRKLSCLKKRTQHTHTHTGLAIRLSSLALYNMVLI